MSPDFSGLLAVMKLDQIRSAKPTAVLAKPTGTSMPQVRMAAKKKAAEAQEQRKKS